MDIQLEILEAETRKLSTGERAAFAQPLLASLDEDTEMDEAWATEIERRIADVEKWCCSGYCHCRCSCPASRRVENEARRRCGGACRPARRSRLPYGES
ncbi:MAG: addiction module protein [Candidatus Accumulibacter sp.]|uniref:addiction module protein n=1 Tax=Accumulibacter sp. TaxID=2053492 RepID=UPI0025DB547C|nr:addiction module protein [Accumulibacter sp.]MCP5248201.1 addiction module protein [Accumulibacter sp.]